MKLFYTFAEFLFFFVVRDRFVAAQTDIWSGQLSEMKGMILSLDSKISSLEGKFASLQVLEYAFKMSNTELHIRNMDTKLNELARQMENMKEILRTSCQSRTKSESETELNSVSDRIRADQDMPFINDLKEKIEDYGEKTRSNFLRLEHLAEENQRHAEKTDNMSRTGFSKLIQRIEKHGSMVEQQLTTLFQSVNNWSPRLSKVSEQLSDVENVMADVQSKIEQNGHKLTNISGSANAKSSVDYSSAVRRVLQMTESSKGEVVRLSHLEPKIFEVVELATKLRTDSKKGRSQEAAIEDLAVKMEKLEALSMPLLLAVPYNFNNIERFLQSIVNSFGNESVCNFDELFRLELSAIKESFSGNQRSAVQQDNNSPIISDTFNRLAAMQSNAAGKDAFEKLSFLKQSITNIQSDLRRSQKNCLPSVPVLPSLGDILG